MNIVVLDGATVNPGDLDWSALQALGEVTIHERTAPEDLVARCTGAVAVLTNKAACGPAELDALPDLKYVGVTATGVNVIDLDNARDRGIVVTNVPEYSTASVAQWVMAHLLNLACRLSHHAAENREGRWCRSADFAWWDRPLVELDGRTLGIVGFGRIGRQVAARAAAFGMKVLVTTRTTPAELPPYAALVDLDRLLAESDAVSLHCPLTPQTAKLINADTLARMKPTAYLINTGRGGLVDESALADALSDGRLAGAGVDVLSTEPPEPNNPLLTAPNCYVTPHNAWATPASRQRLMDVITRNLAAWQAGTPINVVNP